MDLREAFFPKSKFAQQRKGSGSVEGQTRAITQDLIPIADIEDGIVYRKDGQLVTLVRIQAVNISLMSDMEKTHLCNAISEAMNSIDYHYQYYCCERPIDLSLYVDQLSKHHGPTKNVHQKRLIDFYLNQAMSLSSSGEAREKRFYIVLTNDGVRKDSEFDLMTQAQMLVQDLQTAKIDAYLCRDKEIIEVYTLFTRPDTTDFNLQYNRPDVPMYAKQGGKKYE